MKHLITLTDNIKIAIIENYLLKNEILILKKSRGIGGYLEIVTCGNIYGTDIFVEENKYIRAKELVIELGFYEK